MRLSISTATISAIALIGLLFTPVLARAAEVLTIGERSPIPVQALTCWEQADAESIVLTHLKDGLEGANNLIRGLLEVPTDDEGNETGLAKCLVTFSYATILEVITTAELPFGAKESPIIKHVTLNRGLLDRLNWPVFFLTIGPQVRMKGQDA